MPRREDNEVRKDMWGHWGKVKKKKKKFGNDIKKE